MRVLFVEDSKRLQTYVGKGLRKAGCALDAAFDGTEGLWLARENAYDVIILDLMLPEMDGLHLLKTLRDEGNKTHILILTAKDTVEDRVIGLQGGADDYLIKPFAFQELLARVRTLARRGYGVKTSNLVVGDIEINMVNRSVTRCGDTIDLQPREYTLLEQLALRAGEVVTRSEIEQKIYDERAEPKSNVVDATICILRKKIDRRGALSCIQTRRGMGYVLRRPEP